MVIYADGLPDAWFGHLFEIQDKDRSPTRIQILGVTNGNTLMALIPGHPPQPYFNIQGFAMSLLLGRIRRVD